MCPPPPLLPPFPSLLFLLASTAATAVPGADGYLGRRLSCPELELLPRCVVSLIIGRNSDPHVRDGCPERRGVIQSEQQVLVACVSVFVGPRGQVLPGQKSMFQQDQRKGEGKVATRGQGASGEGSRREQVGDRGRRKRVRKDGKGK